MRSSRLRGIRPRLAVRVRKARRIELHEEFGTPLGLVGLVNHVGTAAQSVEGVEETDVLGMRPADVARSAPAGLAELVEPAVVADAVVRVGLDVVTGTVAERAPHADATRPRRSQRS